MNLSLIRRQVSSVGVALYLIVIGCSPRAQPGSVLTADARGVLMEAVSAMRREALGRDRVDWDSVERRLVGRVSAGDSSSEAWPLIGEALAEFNDPHARFFPPAPLVAPAPAPSAGGASSVPVAPARPVIPDRPIGRLLDGGVAYLLVPIRGHADEETMRSYAAEARRLIAEFARQSPRGWIVDLRLNGGGTMWPMFLGLGPLLGDGVHMTSVADGRAVSSFGVSGDEVWIDQGDGRQVQLALTGEGAATGVVREPRVAVLLGPWTMSSGESVAIALRSRPGARSFGEHTGRLSTVTQMYTLSDGSVLVLPVSVMGDRDGRAYPDGIAPDVAVAIGDWPTDDDAVTRAAAEWIVSDDGVSIR